MDREEMIARIQKEEDPLELSIEAWEDKTSVGICPNTLYKWGVSSNWIFQIFYNVVMK